MKSGSGRGPTLARPSFSARSIRWILFASLILIPVAAYAHARLKSSSPSAGAHLNAVPRELRLDFSEVPELTFTKVDLVDASGQRVRLSAVTYATDSKRSVVVAVQGGMPAGPYTVLWQVASDDGHPVRDQFKFVVAPGAAGVGATAPPPDVRDSVAAHTAVMDTTAHHDPTSMPQGNGFGSDSALYVLVRWAMFVTLLLMIGAVTFRQLVLRAVPLQHNADSPLLDDASRRAARFGHQAAGGLLIVLVLRLAAQSVAMHGTADMFNAELVFSMLRNTTWGRGWVLQLVGIVVAGYGFHRARYAARQSERARNGWTLATLGVLGLVFTPGLAGHAASVPKLQALTLLADGLHVLGAGGWFGSLTLMLLAGIPAALSLPEVERASMIATLFNAFSPVALVFAGLVAATGVFAAWMHVGSVVALWQTGYGRTLLWKLGALSIVTATGAYNWLRLKPALGTGSATVRIQQSALREIVIALVVLLVTAVLVAMPTSMDMTM